MARKLGRPAALSSKARIQVKAARNAGVSVDDLEGHTMSAYDRCNWVAFFALGAGLVLIIWSVP